MMVYGLILQSLHLQIIGITNVVRNLFGKLQIIMSYSVVSFVGNYLKNLMRYWPYIFTLTILLLLSCSKEKESICHEEICEYIYNENDSLIQEEIARLTSDLLPKLFDDDKWGQLENLDILIERLNQCNCIVATKVCYACIYTLPPQSEVKLVVTYNMKKNTRIMDLLTGDEEPMKYLRLHDE